MNPRMELIRLHVERVAVELRIRLLREAILRGAYDRGEVNMARVQYATVEEVEAFRRENAMTGPPHPGETRAYQGPYPTVLSERNHWTYRQDTAEFPAYDVAAVSLSPTGQAHPAAGGQGSFSVTKTAEGVVDGWKVDLQSEAASWVTLDSPANQEWQTEWPGQVAYTVAANATGSARQGFMYINGKTYTIDQPAA